MKARAKILPCPRCGQATTRDGRPYWAVRYPGGDATFTYPCAGCHRPNTISPIEFHQLPQEEVVIP